MLVSVHGCLFFCRSLAEISQNEDFLNVHEDTLVYLLQRDDLTVDEVDLFTLVIKLVVVIIRKNPSPESE